MSVTVRDLAVRLGGTELVAGVSFEVGRGGWLGLVGPNGAGKSTLLRAVVGVVAYSGTVELVGVRDRLLDRRRRARLVAYVPQRPQLPLAMTVCDYVTLGRSPHLALFATEGAPDREVVATVLARLELEGLSGRVLGEISGGEAQRAVLGRALAQQAPVLVLDEPTTGLDLGHQEQVLELVDALRAEHGLTVVSAMHDLTVAGRFCDALCLVDRGRVAASGAPAAVLSAEIVGRYFGAAVRVEHDRDGPIVVPVRRRADAAGGS